MKSRIWEKKAGKYAKFLTKIQVMAIFLMQDMWKKRFTPLYRNLYGDAMLVLIQMGTNMAAFKQQTHLSLGLPTKAWSYLSRDSKTLK